jgi:ATP-dependent Clp protease ATP-binding subunit ClpC
MRGRSTIWSLPELQEALFAGQHPRSPHGLLDALLPHIESGTITLSRVTPTALDVLRAARPRVMSAFDVIRVPTPDQEDSIAVARHALEHDGLDVRPTTRPSPVVRPRAAVPARRRAAGRTAPARRHDGRSTRTRTVGTASTAPTCSRRSPPPRGYRSPLSTPRRRFGSRTFARSSSGASCSSRTRVTCVVERIAMIKAAHDPTGRSASSCSSARRDGQDEIAKTLRRFLFGSPDRLVRLDMSEFQTPRR